MSADVELPPVPTPPDQEVGENERPPIEDAVSEEAPNEGAGFEPDGPTAPPDPPPPDTAAVVRGPYVQNPDGTIDCEVKHPKFGWVGFTASSTDVEAHGRAIYDYAATQI